MTGPKRPPVYLTVPAGARPTNCRGCDALIYFIKNAADKWVPVDCQADAQCAPPTAMSEGVGVSHFGNCPEADRFRKGRTA